MIFLPVHSEDFYMSQILLLPKYTQKMFSVSDILLLPLTHQHVLHVRHPTFAGTLRCFTCQKSYFCQSTLRIHVINPTFSSTHRWCFTCQKSYFCQSTLRRCFTYQNPAFAKVHSEDVSHVRNPTFAKVHSEYVLCARSPTFARTLRRRFTCQKSYFCQHTQKILYMSESYFCQSGTGSGGQTVAWCPQRTWLVEHKWQTPGWKPWVCSQQGSVWSESWSAAEQWRWTGHQHIQVGASDLGRRSKKRWNQIKTKREKTERHFKISLKYVFLTRTVQLHKFKACQQNTFHNLL